MISIGENVADLKIVKKTRDRERDKRANERATTGNDLFSAETEEEKKERGGFNIKRPDVKVQMMLQGQVRSNS